MIVAARATAGFVRRLDGRLVGRLARVEDG
jgi:hypothetical protein